MGFSPGDFKDRLREAPVHWEGKDGGRVVLWNDNESEMLVDLELGQAKIALAHLELLVKMADPE